MTIKQAKVVLSTRLEPDLLSQLDALCVATERDRGYHVERAIKEYVQKQMWHVGAVSEGIEDAEAGHLIPLDEIEQKWRARAAKNPD